MNTEKQELKQKITELKEELRYYFKLYSKFMTTFQEDSDNLMQAIENKTGVTKYQMKSKLKIDRLNRIRQVYVHILCQRKDILTGKHHTLNAIGKSINRHHSTILHHRRIMEDFILDEEQTANLVKEIEEEFECLTK